MTISIVFFFQWVWIANTIGIMSHNRMQQPAGHMYFAATGKGIDVSHLLVGSCAGGEASVHFFFAAET